MARRVADLPNELLGVDVMRKAFNPKGRCAPRSRGRRRRTADLFAGAIAAYKNPASRRTIQFDDPLEAAEVIQLADLLLRIVQGRSSPPPIASLRLSPLSVVVAEPARPGVGVAGGAVCGTRLVSGMLPTTGSTRTYIRTATNPVDT